MGITEWSKYSVSPVQLCHNVNRNPLKKLCHIFLTSLFLIYFPRAVTNMNGLYTISNPNIEASAQWDSDYSTFKDVEYFEVALPDQSH